MCSRGSEGGMYGGPQPSAPAGMVPSGELCPTSASVSPPPQARGGRRGRGRALCNNRLIKAREDLGYESAKAAADALRLNFQLLVRYEALKRSPRRVNRDKNWCEAAKKIAVAYGYSPEELWPDAIEQIAVAIDGPDQNVLDDPEAFTAHQQLVEQTEEALKQLTRRERLVLKFRFWNDETLRRVGKRIGATPERVRQIEAKALRKLRHLSRARLLKPFACDDHDDDPRPSLQPLLGQEMLPMLPPPRPEEIVVAEEMIEERGMRIRHVTFSVNDKIGHTYTLVAKE